MKPLPIVLIVALLAVAGWLGWQWLGEPGSVEPVGPEVTAPVDQVEVAADTDLGPASVGRAPIAADPAVDRAMVEFVSGRVFGPSGEPVRGASVVLNRLLSTWPEQRREPVETVLSGDDGRFRIRAPSAESLFVTAVHPGMGLYERVVPRGSQSLSIRLRPGFDLMGYVVYGRTGRKLAECPVTIDAGPWSTGRSRQTVTDENGMFRFSNVDAGATGVVRVTARHPVLEPVARSIGVGSGEQIILSLDDRKLGALLAGSVVHASTRRPVAGARVRAYPSTAWNAGLHVPYEFETGDDGKFMFGGLGSGNVLVEVWHPQLSTTDRIVTPKRRDEALAFELVARSRVAGRVIGPEAEGLELVLIAADGEIGHAVIDSAGEFRFAESFSTGMATLEFVHGDRSFNSSSGRSTKVEIDEAEQTTLELAIGAPSVVKGRVLGAGGEPVAGAILSTPRYQRWTRNPEVLAAVTGADGRFVFRGMAMGDVAFGFTHPDYAAVKRTATIDRPGSTVELPDVQLVRPGRVRGRVTRGGNPLPGVTLFTGRGNDLSQSAVTDADGRYELSRLPPGSHRIIARYSSLPIQVAAETSVVASGGVYEGVDVEFPSGRRFVGRVLDEEGVGVRGAMVVLSDRTGVFSATEEGGVFEMEIPAGAGEILVYSPDLSVSVRETLDSDTDKLDIRLPLVPQGVVTARVLGLPERRPMAISVVRIESLDVPPTSKPWSENIARQRNPRARWLSMSSGQLELRRFPAGLSRLTIYCPDYAPHVLDLELGSGEIKELGSVLLEPGAKVRGVVRNADGEPVSGAFVHLGDPIEFFVEKAAPKVRTDSEGAFEISGVTPDSSRLAVLGSGYTVAELKLRPQDLLRREPLTIELSRNPTLKVQLRSGDENLAELRLLAIFLDGMLIRVDSTDAEGVYETPLAMAGVYRITQFGSAADSGVELVVGADAVRHTVELDVEP